MNAEMKNVIMGVCGEPLPVKDIADLIGKSETTTRDYLKELEEEKKVRRLFIDKHMVFQTVGTVSGDADEVKTEPTPEEPAERPKAAASSKTEKPATADVKVQRGRTKVDVDATITYVQDTNPKRSTAAERFALYEVGKTVQDYLNAGGLLRDVPYDVSKGFIKLSD